MNKTMATPFGLRFEERPTAADFIIPIYDEEEDISVVVDNAGHKIPYVEYYENLGTKTFTKVANKKPAGISNSLKMSGTRTLTEVQAKSSDSDDSSFSFTLSTKTQTFVQS